MKKLMLLLMVILFVFPFFIKAQVGIGSITPTSMLHVADTVNGTSSWAGSFIDIQNVSSVLNTNAGLRFKVDNDVLDGKFRAGIFFNRNTSNANGTLIFSNSDNTGPGNVTTTTDARMVITSDGLVGLGTLTPNHLLSIVGEDASTNGSSGVFMDIQNTSTSHGVYNGIRFRNGATPETFKGGIFYQDVDGFGKGSLLFCNNNFNGGGNVTTNDARMIIKSDGSVGMGTIDPDANLHLLDQNSNLYVKLESDFGSPTLSFDGTTGLEGLTYKDDGSDKASIGYDIDNNYLKLSHGGMSTIIKDGKIGVWTIPQHLLHLQNNSGDSKALLASAIGRSMLMLDGTTGLSEVRFQEDDNYKAAIGYNHDNDNLFLYHNGNMKFSDGDLYVDNDYNYNSGKIYTMQYPACTFRTGTNAEYTDDVVWNEDGIAYINYHEYIGLAKLYCPANLPQGAVINTISLICYVESSFPFFDNYCSVRLYRKALTAATSIELCIINVYDTQSNIEIHSTSSILNNIVDNVNYQYFLKVELGDVSVQNTEFHGAFVTYTIDKVSQ